MLSKCLIYIRFDEPVNKLRKLIGEHDVTVRDKQQPIKLDSRYISWNQVQVCVMITCTV